ncbi:hypothetical protein NDU88_001793 [Pleurodeles waltl]|uniref:Uncharacterized protein n=1 Tax=Pleurodeles waltl TaxID=8319 RepID=A0AAV7TIT3_PLEWA|nr:hypothetical protein NDU88_001793 [Pleurodeles waltl]
MVVTLGIEWQDGSESGVLRQQHSSAPDLVDQASCSPWESWRHIGGLMGGDTQRNMPKGTLLARRGHLERLLAEETGDGRLCRRCTPECGGALVSADRILGHQQDRQMGTLRKDTEKLENELLYLHRNPIYDIGRGGSKDILSLISVVALALQLDRTLA